MPHKVIDLTGRMFGRLTVTWRGPNDKRGGVTWRCKCTCGGTTSATSFELRSGRRVTCGCRTSSHAFTTEERLQQVVDLLKGKPWGLRVKEIADALGLSEYRTGELLRTLRDAELVATTCSAGPGARWAEKAVADAIRQERERVDPAEMARLAERRRRAQCQERRRLELQQEQDRADEEFLRMRRVIVPAAGREPPHTTAPRSVFHWAAAS